MKHNNIVDLLRNYAEIKLISKKNTNWYYAINIYKTIAWIKHNNEIVKSIRVYLGTDINPWNSLPISNAFVNGVSFNSESKNLEKAITAIDNFLSLKINKRVNKLNLYIEIESKKLKRTARLVLEDLSSINQEKIKYTTINNLIMNLGHLKIPSIELKNINIGMIDNLLNNKIDSGIFLDYVKEYYPETEVFINET
jgi:hypothetical protein